MLPGKFRPFHIPWQTALSTPKDIDKSLCLKMKCKSFKKAEVNQISNQSRIFPIKVFLCYTCFARYSVLCHTEEK